MKHIVAATKELIAKYKPKFQRFADAFPLRLNFFLLVLLSLAGYWYISSRQPSEVEASSFIAVISVLLKLVLVFALAILVCSILTTFIPFSLFSHRARVEKGFLSFSFNGSEEDDNVHSTVHVKVARLSFPLLGGVRLHLYYDGGYRTKGYPFPSRDFSFLFAEKADLKCKLDLYDVRSYDINAVRVHFEDMFRLFSFSHSYRIDRRLYTFPEKREVEQIQPTPALAKETNLRTEIVRRVEGELLFFKDFEPSDDIRRIIWKIYAKNKELVVRVPELRNPYASEISFLASYKNSLLYGITDRQESDIFLNHYKHLVWSLYHELSVNKEVHLKLLSDQELSVKPIENVNPAQQQISASDWQNSTTLESAIHVNTPSIICLSALSDKQDVKRSLEYLNTSTVVVLCRLSEVFDVKSKASYLRMLLLKPKRGTADKPLWRVSPLRAKLAKNERELEELLRKSDANVYVVNG